MIKETLSEIKPMESLREQLIREGKITPIELRGLKERLDDAKRKISSIILDRNIRRSNIEKQLSDLYLSFQRAFVSVESSSNPTAASAYAFLALRKFDRIQKMLSTENKEISKCFVILRDGFFFSFKENKKNTP